MSADDVIRLLSLHPHPVEGGFFSETYRATAALPASVLPFRVARARLDAKIAAPGRRVTVTGFADGRAVELAHVDSPLDPIRVEIADERLLRLDDDGGLHLKVALSGTPQSGATAAGDAPAEGKWTIEYLEVEIAGTAAGDR